MQQQRGGWQAKETTAGRQASSGPDALQAATPSLLTAQAQRQSASANSTVSEGGSSSGALMFPTCMQVHHSNQEQQTRPPWLSLKMFFLRSMMRSAPPGVSSPTSPVWNQPPASIALRVSSCDAER